MGFVNFKWSPNGELVLFDSKTLKDLKNEIQPNLSRKSTDLIRFYRGKSKILSQVIKFYNEIYSYFKTMQNIEEKTKEKGILIPEDRSNEIINISNMYLVSLVTLSTQIERSLKTGDYIDNDNEVLQLNYEYQIKEALKNSAMAPEKVRLRELFQSIKQDGFKQLILFCGSIDSFYALISSFLLKELGIKAICIVRDCAIQNSGNIKESEDLRRSMRDKIEMNQARLIVLSKVDYAKRVQYVDSNNLMDPYTHAMDIDRVYCDYSETLSDTNITLLVWRAAHMFYFSSSITPYQLVDLIASSPERKELQLITPDIGVEDPSICYEHIAKLISHTCIDEALVLLALLSRAPKHYGSVVTRGGKTPVGALIDCLQKMPIRKRVGSIQEYNMQWSRWRQESNDTLGLYTTVSTGMDPSLLDAIQIVLGDQASLSKYCSSLVPLAVANSLFVEPVTALPDVRNLFIRIFNSLSSASIIDQILLLLAGKDLPAAIELISQHFPLWFVTHLTDLLYHHPYILRKHPADVSSLSNTRDYFVLDYAEELSAVDSSMMDLSTRYLKYVNNGGHYVDSLISRQPIACERLTIFNLRELSSEMAIKSIYRLLSQRDFKRKRYAASLGWLITSNDQTRLAQLSHYLVSNHLDSEIFDDLPALIDAYGSKLLSNNPDLLFLVKYRELVQLWKDRRFDLYSRALVDMLRDKQIPKRFWLKLLLDIRPLLDSNKTIYFNIDDSLMIQSHIQEIKTSHLFQDYSIQCSNQEIQQFQLLLSKNISKALSMPQPNPSSLSIDLIQSNNNNINFSNTNNNNLSNPINNNNNIFENPFLQSNIFKIK